MPTLHHTFYVSRSTIPPASAEQEVARIVETAIACNAPLDVTGALLFTGVHFAQVLEGPREAVDELMRRITADPRHRDLRVTQSGPLATRRFARWAMAYAGPSRYLDSRARALLAPAPNAAQDAALSEQIIAEMAAALALADGRPLTALARAARE